MELPNIGIALCLNKVALLIVPSEDLPELFTIIVVTGLAAVITWFIDGFLFTSRLCERKPRHLDIRLSVMLLSTIVAAGGILLQVIKLFWP